jgi:hypothetical protein
MCTSWTDDKKEVLVIDYEHYLGRVGYVPPELPEPLPSPPVEVTKDYPIVPTEPQEPEGKYPEGAFIFGGDYGDGYLHLLII